MTYSDTFLYGGTVNFRFRALTKLIEGTMQNGIFKFKIDDVDQKVAEDYRTTGVWTDIQRPVSPGSHKLQWSFLKYNNLKEYSQDDVAAEIEYIKIHGVRYAPTSCRMCGRGVANSDHTKCEPCPPNTYLEDMAAAGGKCLECPTGTYSPSNTVGRDSCLKRKACEKDDYTVSYSACDMKSNQRTKSYVWKTPAICDDKSGMALPKEEIVKCAGCSRGEHRDPESDQCVFCDAGHYQDHDNHDGNGVKIKECMACPAGSFARRTLEFSHFEKMPEGIMTICSEANDVGSPE